MDSSSVTLEVQELTKYFPVPGLGLLGRRIGDKAGTAGPLRAVDGVNFKVRQGETLGLVGESGCGKTTVARCILRLTEPTHGRILFEGVDLAKLSTGDLRRVRRRVQMIFQHPDTCLNPRLTVRGIVGEPLRLFGIARSEQQVAERVLNLLHRVGMPQDAIDRYPHELSGGQKQRVGIMRALASSPSLIVLDEPTSALDVSVRAQVLGLLKNLQVELKTAYLFISHDLSTIRYLCDRVAVMYVGKIVEVGRTDEVFAHPLHPYTQALLSAVPIPDPQARRRERLRLTGELSRALIRVQTCPLAARCPFVFQRCQQQEPELREVNPGHWAACFLNEEPLSAVTGWPT